MFVRYVGPNAMRANELFRATIEITLEETIDAGGWVAVAARHVSDFGDAQTKDPKAENYVSVSTSRASAALRVTLGMGRSGRASAGYRHPWNRGFDVVLERGRLLPGDTVTIRLGGERGFRGQSFVEESFALRIGIRPSAEADWVALSPAQSPHWPIIGTEPTAIRVRVTDVNGEAPGRSVCLKLEDTYGNPAGPCEVDVDLLLDDRLCLHSVKMTDNMAEVPQVPLPVDGAWHRLSAVTSDGRLFGRSNPFGPSLVEGYHLYWGEMHSQSGLCDGTNSPAYLYRYARQAAGLDFASVTSHDFEMTPDEWQEVKQATREAHHPGTFVTFLGYEWSAQAGRGGDNNVYFLGDEGPLLYNAPIRAADPWEPAGQYVDRTRTLADVISELGDSPFLIVPHCGGRIANFDYYDARCMPVFEIHSCHRTYEHVAHEAIRRGLQFGFVGGSDDHRGALGDSLPAARERFFSARNGLIAVYARELTRESLWEAIFARRVYATNGCRMALSFTANGEPMGRELRIDVGEVVRLSFTAVLDGWFDHAELVRGTEVIARFEGTTNQIRTFTGEHTVRAQAGTTAYYVRVHQTDGGIAWSSPVWVTAKYADHDRQ